MSIKNLLNNKRFKMIGAIGFLITQIGFTIVGIGAFIVSFPWLPLSAVIILAALVFLLGCIEYYTVMTLENSHEDPSRVHIQPEDSLKSNIFIIFITPMIIVAALVTFAGAYTIVLLLITAASFPLSSTGLFIVAIVFSAVTTISASIYDAKVSYNAWNLIRLNNSHSHLSNDQHSISASTAQPSSRNSRSSIVSPLNEAQESEITDKESSARRESRGLSIFFNRSNQGRAQIAAATVVDDDCPDDRRIERSMSNHF